MSEQWFRVHPLRRTERHGLFVQDLLRLRTIFIKCEFSMQLPSRNHATVG